MGDRGDVVKGWVIVIVMCHKVCERFYTMCFEYSCASIRLQCIQLGYNAHVHAHVYLHV